METSTITFQSKGKTLVSGWRIDNLGTLYKHLDTDFFVCEAYSCIDYLLEDNRGEVFWGSSRSYRYATLDEFLQSIEGW